MQRHIELALIYGSARTGRFCDTVAGWAASEIGRHGGFALDRIDPASPDIANGVAGHDTIASAALKRRLDGADAFVVVTPEYNHSFPAPLKALIDSAGREWRAKPVGFVSYGGVSGGLRAVEQLRLVFAELHAVGIRDCVSFAGAPNHFDDNGELADPEPATRAMATMLSHLAWWAHALRQAREQSAYGEAAE